LAGAIEQREQQEGKPQQDEAELCALFPHAVPPYIENSVIIYKELHMQCAKIATI